jgi:hypothetical protein
MSHREQDVHRPLARHAQDLKVVFEWLLDDVDLAAIGLRRDCSLSPRGLAFVALLWVWSGKFALTQRFRQAGKIGRRLWPSDVSDSISYQAFMKLLVRWSGPILLVLSGALRDRMQTTLAPYSRIAGFWIFGSDGSRLELPRTVSNERRFSPQKSQSKKNKRRGQGRNRGRKATRRTAAARQRRARQKKADSPQLWLTTFWHAGSGLPWDWRIGPSDSSERAHVLEMIEYLPPDALVTADAGFVGYEFWMALLASRRQFIIRVGANVNLLRKLGYARESRGTVYLWPDRAASKRQPPLALRLVVLQGARCPVTLVTSVTSAQRLSDRQVAEIYKLRWGIELYYRHFKQTFGRSKLRSLKAEHAEVEAHWAMLGLWALLLHAEAYLQSHGIHPAELSVAAVLRAYRQAMDEYKSDPDPGESLWELLQLARLDGYHRSNKSSRAHPRKKYEKPPSPAKINNATPQQIAIAQTVKQSAIAKRLTA